ncbi:hypothetical protein ACHAXN_005428 [Cyclotella atomus]
MMIQQLAILSLLAATTATETKQRYGAKKRSEFFAAMKTANLDASFTGRKLSKDQTPSLDTFAEYVNGDSDKSRNLRKKIMGKAKYISPEEIKEREARELNQYVNSKYNWNNGEGAELYSQKDGADDYFVASGAWNNAFGFDVTQYSFSYHRCAEVRQFDDVLAATEDANTVFSTKHFAVFRFCPSKTCEGMTEEQIEAEREAEYQEYMKNLNSQNAENQAAAYAEARSGNVNAYNAYAANQYIQMQAEQARLDGEEYEPPSWYFDKRIIGGAKGSGCSSNYGEYMLELEDFLAIMAEYHSDRFDVYCDYCQGCMYNAYNKWMNGYQGGRKLDIDEDWEADFERLLEESGERDLAETYYAQCPEWDTCKSYKNVCGAGIDDTLEQYFECTEVERNNGMIAYIGPHCSDDGTTINLGIYSDEYCSEYIGKGTNINNFLGFQLEETALEGYVTGSLARDVIPDDYYEQYWSDELQAYYDPQEQLCVPCAASAQLYEQKGNLYQQGSDDDYHSQYDGEVNDLCLNLYMASARCDKHFRSYSMKDKYAKMANYYSNMDLSCEFIESVVKGAYDEMGFVKMENQTDISEMNFFTKTFVKPAQTFTQEVTPLQIFGLVSSIGACALFALWAIVLAKNISPKKVCRNARRGFRSNLPAQGPVTRQDSGIVLGRSQTMEQGESYYSAAN